MVAVKEIRIGILTVSDRGARGEREDRSGVAIAELVAGIGGVVERQALVPDERQLIVEQLQQWCDDARLDVVLSTGGTGPAPRDVTPEATREVIEREMPGMAEAMRAEGLRHTRRAMLSRGVVGLRGRTLIVNLPGSERAVRENLSAILDVLPHAVTMARGKGGDCGDEQR